MLKDLMLYKNYILDNALGELKYRYAGSFMGIFWNIANPLFQILIYTIVFSNIMQAKLPSMNYSNAFAVYLCSGLLAWLAFAECISRGTYAFIENNTFLKKLPIPEHVFICQIMMSALFNGLISYVILLIVVLFISEQVAVGWFLVPIVLTLFVLFGFGLALLLSAVNVFFRDVHQMVGILTTVWMWLTPIIYVKDILPDTMEELMKYNLAYPFVDALQKLIVYDRPIGVQQWLHMFIITLVSIVVGYFILSKLRKEIRDNL